VTVPYTWPTSCSDPFPQTPDPPVPTAAFCAFYDLTCAGAYGSASNQFASESACVTKYDLLNETQKRCLASKLCVAGLGVTSFCALAAGGGINPCGI
jgi:hypothetical protein